MQHEGTGSYFLIQNGVGYQIATKEILENRFHGKPIRVVPQAMLETFRPGNAVKLLDGSLVKTTGSPVVYVISEGTRRPISNEATFTQMGWRFSDVQIVDPATLAVHQEGLSVHIEP